MKKWWMLILTAVLLTGCGSRETLETVADELAVPVMAQPKRIQAKLPGEAAMPTVESDSGRLYLCQDYEIMLQTLAGGDIDATLQSCTGFDSRKLTVIETAEDGLKRYDCAFTSLGEGTQTVGRLTVLDDGNYHYVLTVTADRAYGAEMTAAWQQLSDSFQINIAG